jgi:hypothetical protein
MMLGLQAFRHMEMVECTKTVFRATWLGKVQCKIIFIDDGYLQSPLDKGNEFHFCYWLFKMRMQNLYFKINDLILV